MITVPCLTLARDGFNWSDNLSRSEAVFAIVSIFIYSIAPAAITFYFITRIKEYRTESFMRKFKGVIGEFNWKYRFNSVFISLFCYRRMVLVLLILFVGDFPNAQILI
jgi:hypothetical protein